MSKNNNQEIRDYSKEIRNLANYLVDYSLDSYNVKNNMGYRVKVLAKIIQLYGSEFIVHPLINIFKTDDYVRGFKYVTTLIKMQAYTDYCRYQKYIFVLTNKEVNILPYECFEENIQDGYIEDSMLGSLLKFNSLSGYEKILYTKSLSMNEHNYLKSLNPFYEIEKDKYDIDITLELIERHIEKWQKSFEDKEKSYKAAANFLYNLNKINDNDARKILTEINQILGLTTSDNYDELSSKEKLINLLKKYHKYNAQQKENTKKLKLMPDENNENK
ncbi:MAG: hypothetical protein J6B64_00505 [Bacilli bacterium]|nr:hypothetical protein [Bacilli bacterium]MBP3635613.1 hypothetical protein [Bacilli bacterium]